MTTMNPWVFYALITAFSLATADAISKKALGRSNEYVIAWVREGYALPFLFLAFFFIDIPSLDRTFWLSLLLMIPLEIAAIILYVKAIKISPLSLTIPFLAVSPVFIILIAFLILGEVPDRSGLLGILLIVAGAYLLNIRTTREDLLGPIKAIRRERGSIFMIIVALIYSVTATLGKVAVQHSGPIFFGVFYPFLLTLILSVVLWRKGLLPEVLSRPMTFLAIGIFTAIMILTHFTAISMTDVAYMISVKRASLVFSVLYGRVLFAVKRASLVFSVLYGRVLFGEENIRERLTGSVLMIAGMVSITIF